MDTRKIKKLIELVKETGIGELEIKSGEESVRISTGSSQTIVPAATTSVAVSPATPAPAAQAPATPPPAAAPADTQDMTNAIASPMVGTVYLSAKPGDAPFVAVGQHVNVGDTLCLIEAMKMFNKIEADKAGVISARLVDNEQPVEYDQPLFIIE